MPAAIKAAAQVLLDGDAESTGDSCDPAGDMGLGKGDLAEIVVGLLNG